MPLALNNKRRAKNKNRAIKKIGKKDNPKAKMEEIKANYTDGKLDELDGISVEYDNWRFNVRISNTEPLLRLNVESKGDVELMKNKTDELLQLIRN